MIFIFFKQLASVLRPPTMSLHTLTRMMKDETHYLFYNSIPSYTN